MRYPASEKVEIVRLVEQSHLPVRRTLEMIGIPRATFYRWYDLYQTGGPEALEDRSPRPSRVWNRIPDPIRDKLVHLALKQPELSPRELAVRFTDTESYFVSEASVYRLLKAHDLITSPAFIVMKAADEFKGQDHRAQPALADGLHLPQGGRVGLVLSLHRAGRLLPLHRGLEALHHHGGKRRDRHPEPGSTGIRARAGGRRSPSQALVSTMGRVTCRASWRNGSSGRRMRHTRGAPFHPMTQGKIERWHQTLKNRILLEHYYLPGDLEAEIATFVDHYNTRVQRHPELTPLRHEELAPCR